MKPIFVGLSIFLAAVVDILIGPAAMAQTTEARQRIAACYSYYPCETKTTRQERANCATARGRCVAAVRCNDCRTVYAKCVSDARSAFTRDQCAGQYGRCRSWYCR